MQFWLLGNVPKPPCTPVPTNAKFDIGIYAQITDEFKSFATAQAKVQVSFIWMLFLQHLLTHKWNLMYILVKGDQQSNILYRVSRKYYITIFLKKKCQIWAHSWWIYHINFYIHNSYIGNDHIIWEIHGTFHKLKVVLDICNFVTFHLLSSSIKI